MVHKQAALELAAFLDSNEAKALVTLRPEDVRKIAESFLAVSYDELGKAPRLLDGQDVHEALSRHLPSHFGARDPLAEHVPAVLGAFFAHLEATQVVIQAFEIRRGLEEKAGEFLETVRTGRNAEQATRVKQDPFVHHAPKLGRNDPCWCGSGEKFKKCHGRNG